MVPPTMAPVWLGDWFSLVGGAAVAELDTRLLVGDVTLAVVVELFVEEVVLELELELELELLLVVVVLLHVLLLQTSVLEVSALEVSALEVLVIELSEADVVLTGIVTVPSVVGSLNLVGVAVKLKVKVSLSTGLVIPLAVANTLVARSLAVPHPNW